MGKAARRERQAARQFALYKSQLYPPSLIPMSPEELRDGIRRARLRQPPVRAWRSSTVIAMEFHDSIPYTGPLLDVPPQVFVRLSIQRNAAHLDPGRIPEPFTWEELMAAKRQIGYGDRWAVEVFPPEEHVVEKAYMRHLFLVDYDRIPFAWTDGGRDDP
jgi:hypothetical protein